MDTITDTKAFRRAPGIYYCTCKPNEKCYVGQSTDVYSRVNYGHIPQLRGNRHDNRYMQNSWNKYGEGSFVWTVLEYCSVESLNERETYWIKYLYTEYPCGFNLTTGGDNTFERSEETRKRLSESWDEERKKELGRKTKEKWASEDMRKRYCQAMTEAWTDERRALISEQRKRRWSTMTEEEKVRCRRLISEHHSDVSGPKNPKARAVKCVETQEVFLTMKDAAEHFRIRYSTFKGHMQGRLKDAGGLHFEYV